MMNYFERAIWADTLFAKQHTTSAMPNAENAQAWMDRIENDLSPENLSCDGEVRGLALVTKRRELEAALAHVVSLVQPSSPMPDEGAKDGNAFMGFADQFSLRAQYSRARRERTRSREIKLNAAVTAGFREGAEVLIRNGVRGVIVKINRTRVKVKGDDKRMWSVPPSCMTLIKGSRAVGSR